LESVEFPPVKKRQIQANLGGGEVSSNGGVQLLLQVDRQVGCLMRLRASKASALALS
jgi:hypothetical protein